MTLIDELRPSGERASRNVSVVSAVERALSACHADALRDPLLDVAKLASQSGLSRHYSTRVFTEAVGEPPGRFMRRRRMEEAARLLAGTALGVKAVALRCGLEDPNSFCARVSAPLRQGTRRVQERFGGQFRSRDLSHEAAKWLAIGPQ